MRDETSDDELEAQLRSLAAGREPVPAELVAAAIEAFTSRDPDTELAELIFDSLLDQDASTLVRGGQERLISFRGGDRSVDLEVTVAGASRSIIGQVTPPSPVVVSIRHRDGAISVEADELGRFRAERIPPGPFSLRLPADQAQADQAQPGPAQAGLVTDWISI
ncbi:MAG TPA: hypothetical protein VFI65_19700 [Streptosporangiaceae bacterium]|nr:hypothetical protein [Streptosporangiaceae bacterium]